MFVHLVLFQIEKRNLKLYLKDCLLWGKAAKAWKGFIACHALTRTNHRNHYASLYAWKTKKAHDTFMKKNHDVLVSRSNCPVKVIGYYDFVSSQEI